jgi:spore germination protein KC
LLRGVALQKEKEDRRMIVYRHATHLVMLSTILFLLTGCWDQNLLKETTLVKSLGFDQANEDQITVTGISRNLPGAADEGIQIFSTVGFTPRQARLNLERKVSERIDVTSLKTLLIGEELARKPIYPLLDVFYRDPRNALHAKLAVVEGRAQDLLMKRYPDKPNVIDYVLEMITSAERTTVIPQTNIQFVCPIMFDPGQDFLLPYLKHGETEIELQGLAMFNGQQFTGTLNAFESTMFLLLHDQKATKAPMSVKIFDQENEIENYVTIDIKKLKRKLRVQPEKKSKVKVEIELFLKVEIDEYPPDHVLGSKHISEFAKRVSQALTKDAERVMRKMQEANCDGLGIGRRLIAFHSDYWNQLTWKDVYPTIDIAPKVHVEILQSGIIH